MRYLLDTHVVLWMLDDAPRLGRRSREQLTDPANDVYVSVMSIWEMAVMARIGKLEADVGEVIRYLAPTGSACLTCGPRIYCNLRRCLWCRVTKTRSTIC